MNAATAAPVAEKSQQNVTGNPAADPCAIAHTLRRPMEPRIAWVPVADILPDADETVLIHAPNSFEPVWLGYTDGADWYDVNADQLPAGMVTHWSPLPKPPEEGAELIDFELIADRIAEATAPADLREVTVGSDMGVTGNRCVFGTHSGFFDYSMDAPMHIPAGGHWKFEDDDSIRVYGTKSRFPGCFE